jgi:hypothetical protein
VTRASASRTRASAPVHRRPGDAVGQSQGQGGCCDERRHCARAHRRGMRGVADNTIWLAAAGGAHQSVVEPSAAAVALMSRLKESAGPLAQLGACGQPTTAHHRVDGGVACGRRPRRRQAPRRTPASKAASPTVLSSATMRCGGHCSPMHARRPAPARGWQLEDGATSLSLSGAM